MPTDLDRQMAPVVVEDMEGIVIDIGYRPSLDVMFCADVPHRRLSPPDEHQKEAVGDRCFAEILFGKLVLALPCRTVNHRDAAGLGITANAATEPVSQPHQVGTAMPVPFRFAVKNGRKYQSLIRGYAKPIKSRTCSTVSVTS